MLTYNDVNRDIKVIVERVSDTNRPIPSMMRSFKIASVLPLIGLFLSTLTFLVVCSSMNNQNVSLHLLYTYIVSGGALPVYISFILSLAQFLMLVPYVSLYNSIPSDIKSSVPLLLAFKKGVMKSSFIYVATLLISCIAAFMDELFLFVTPALMFVAIFVASISVNLRIANYGIGALISKLRNSLV